MVKVVIIKGALGSYAVGELEWGGKSGSERGSLVDDIPQVFD